MLEHQKEGIQFEKGNVKALAQAIMYTWEQENQVEEMCQNARVRARKNHDADANYKMLLEIYNDIAKYDL